MWVLVCLLFIPQFIYGQVSPEEIKDPQLKALEKTYMKSLLEMKRAVGRIQFPFEFSLNRYAGLDPKEQVGADQRGLEFVNFHGRAVLKVTGNYNASYSADLLTSNQRANRVFDEIISPILQVLPTYFSNQDGFNHFGFEISYHVRRRAQGYEYEGRENFVLVMERSDALGYSVLKESTLKQEALARSETYLNGKEFVLALGQRDSIDLETRDHTTVNPSLLASAQGLIAPSKDSRGSDKTGDEAGVYRTLTLGSPAGGGRTDPVPASTATPTQADVDALQTKFQSQIDAMAKDGLAKFHFVEYAPPSFVVFQKKIFLQLTLRNPASFDMEGTSIYKRAARSFDLFLAPQLKPILDKIPEDADFAGLDVTVLNDLTSKTVHSSEAAEFVAPLRALRRFVNAEITNQELIDQSIVLVNGVRIALNLQQVE
ncbi:MAG: hypothetical protein LAO21_08110 [Acidobacteriia bacterium]|nr:hypothetical protein [Terriglobia bacterium]